MQITIGGITKEIELHTLDKKGLENVRELLRMQYEEALKNIAIVELALMKLIIEKGEKYE